MILSLVDRAVKSSEGSKATLEPVPSVPDVLEIYAPNSIGTLSSEKIFLKLPLGASPLPLDTPLEREEALALALRSQGAFPFKDLKRKLAFIDTFQATEEDLDTALFFKNFEVAEALLSKLLLKMTYTKAKKALEALEAAPQALRRLYEKTGSSAALAYACAKAGDLGTATKILKDPSLCERSPKLFSVPLVFRDLVDAGVPQETIAAMLKAAQGQRGFTRGLRTCIMNGYFDQAAEYLGCLTVGEALLSAVRSHSLRVYQACEKFWEDFEPKKKVVFTAVEEEALQILEYLLEKSPEELCQAALERSLLEGAFESSEKILSLGRRLKKPTPEALAASAVDELFKRLLGAFDYTKEELERAAEKIEDSFKYYSVDSEEAQRLEEALFLLYKDFKTQISQEMKDKIHERALKPCLKKRRL